MPIRSNAGTRTAQLVGGLYGVKLGRAFFGESMFSRATDASKVALAWLVARLKVGDFTLLDCQFMTEHLASLGAVSVSRDAYVALLSAALGDRTGGSGVRPAPARARRRWRARRRGAAAAARIRRARPAARSRPAPPGAAAPAGKVIAQLLGQTS